MSTQTLPTPFSLPSDETILDLNESIEAILRAYLPDSSQLAIIFDLPDDLETSPDINTVSVFLYQIQEDLELRAGKSRLYNASTGVLEPGTANVRCCYLITYWEAAPEQTAFTTGARSQSMVIMNQALNALLNSRELEGIPNAYTRVIPPSEQLTSVSNFWQSMGNKPRLYLNYEVTVPITLTDKNDTILPISSIESELAQKPEVDVYQQAGKVLWGMLFDSLNTPTPMDEASKMQLYGIEIMCTPFLAQTPEPDGYEVTATLSGTVAESLSSDIQVIADEWLEANPTCLVEGASLWVRETNYDSLVSVVQK